MVKRANCLPCPHQFTLADANVRRRGYETEDKLWTSLKVPLAAAMNGIKGEVNVFNRRRGRKDALHSAIDMAHIDRQTLDAMLGAMQESFPMFRRYFKAKAKYLGEENSPGMIPLHRWVRSNRITPSMKPEKSS